MNTILVAPASRRRYENLWPIVNRMRHILPIGFAARNGAIDLTGR
jgi:hypothetical protein